MDLHLLHVPMRIDLLTQLGRDRGMPINNIDIGYAIHMAFGELFGEKAPSVFSIGRQRREYIDVLAYAQHDAVDLTAQAEMFAGAREWAICKWDECQSKKMPSVWKKGQRLGFRVRTCPVKRGTSPHGKRGERDAFFYACEQTPGIERESAYLEWFAELAGRAGGLVLERHRLTSYRQVQLCRRAHGSKRQSYVIERPDVLFHGVIEITDGQAFAEILRCGIGRHKAFGFGMLLLCPPSDRAC